LIFTFRRAEKTPFWMVGTALFSLALALGSMALGARAPMAWAAAGLLLPLPGLVWRPWFDLGIRVWNRSVLALAVVVRAYVLKVCYYLLLGAVSRAGSSLDVVFAGRADSRWIARPRHDAGAERSPLGTSTEWWGGLLSVARQPANAWMFCLLPVMVLLRLVRDESRENAIPSSTYTLY
jgi:hypothetical protein